MKICRRSFLHLTGGLALSPALSRSAEAQTYPTRPITIIAERMRGALGQPVIVENVSGAAGTIGVGRVARAAPDGYTISLGPWNSHVVTGAIYSLQWDLLKDFEPVAVIADNPAVIVSKSAAPATNLKELIAWIKANPDKLSAGTSGVGAATHVAGILFQKLTATHFQFVPYRGSGPALQDLVAGQIDLMFDQVANAMPQARAGKIKAYAVTAKARASVAPDVLTVDEAGLPDFYISVWHGMWAPKGTAKDVLDKLNAAVVETLGDPTVQGRLRDLGQEIPPREQQTPQGLDALQKADIEKWWPIIKAAGIKPG
jgi:tripartite-type tricarboxylate transporter receptor subunit TctC